jgi:hypothetical protein
MKKTHVDNVFLKPNDIVTLKKMKHIYAIEHSEKRNTTQHIRKIDKDTYVDLRTGEKKEFNHSENRGQNTNSLGQTFKKLRDLINTNFEGKPNELHVTLTYAENMTDTEQLYRDFKNFMDKFRKKYKNISSIDYLSIIEPQGRGAWHSHCLLRFNDLDKIYIKNKDLADIWSHGFVTIKSLKNVDNIGAYLSAYLADIELTEENMNLVTREGKEVLFKNVDGKEKKFIKGGRLHMYPPGMRLFRPSRGIVHPEKEVMTYKKAKKIVGSVKPHFKKSVKIEKDNFSTVQTYEHYNKKRI